MAQQPRSSTSSPALNPPSHSPSPRPTTSSSNNDNSSSQNIASGEEAEEGADLPLTLAASVILDALPRDAHKALETAGELRDAKGEIRKKVKVRLTPLANTPSLKQPVFMCSASQKFAYIANFLRNRLKIDEGQGVHCYVNSVFAPALDEGVGGLWSCFKTGDELVVSYSLAQAFG